MNGVKGSKGGGKIMLLKYSRNLVSGPLDERETKPSELISRVFLDLGTSASFKEGFQTLVPTISIVNKNIKEMGFLFVKGLFIRYSQHMSS